MKALAGALALLVVVACGGNQPRTVDAARVLRDGAMAMAALKTVSATVKLTKGTISIQGFTLVSAQTSVRMPADSDTTYKVKEKDITFAIEIVIVGGHFYLYLPLIPIEELTPTQAATYPDMAKLFDPTTGLPAIIPAGSNPKYVATDQVDGKDADQVATSYTPEQMHSLLASLSSTGPVGAKVWVDVNDHLIRKAVLAGAFGDGGTDATVEVDISNFNGTVHITTPSP